ncbi:Inactive rhomboid protein 1 [Collichthys lucidus]|uniref:Inactive rhomboid protein 1 n=2 Tax=Sciaenidae TaxID=30870 RepID=A0A4U5VND7_COLLU|nr:Inactive rhomboid protein 1 [Collichthys lucidus]
MDEPGSRSSSLQRKKPPWLKLDIPTIQLTLDDASTLTQPVKRLRSVSMPGENPQACIAALETSNNYLRPPLERLPSFTQSIKR